MSGRRRSGLGWQDGIWSFTPTGGATAATYGITYDPLASGGGFGRFAVAIYGDLFNEESFDADVGGGSRHGAILDKSIQKDRWVERIVGDIAYRGFTYNGVAVGSAGSNPIWTCRFGVVVLPSDGKLGVPAQSLGGSAFNGDFSQDDIELNWMYLEQFSVVGADMPGSNVLGASPSTDGLNHFVVDRHYDIRVGRHLEPHDLLIFQWEVSLSMYTLPELSVANEPFRAINFVPMVRILASDM